MPDFINQQIDPPENWQDFEKLCADLWKAILKDENTQMNGRGGQEQCGVDVYGRKDGDGAWVGVQCKGKDGRYGKAVTKSELNAEVEKAKKFVPKIQEFVLATTAPNDSAIQKVAREITEEHDKEGLFKVDVFGWDEIQRRIAGYPDIIEVHFPGKGNKVSQILEGIETIKLHQTGDETKQELLLDAIPTKVADELVSRGFFPESNSTFNSDLEKSINAEIDGYRDLIKHRPQTALDLLESLKKRHFDKINDHSKFRIITNIGAAKLNLGDEGFGSTDFLEAKEYAPKDEKAMSNVALVSFLKGDIEEAKKLAQEAIVIHPESESAYSLLVSCAINDEEIINPESIVPSKLHFSSHVAYAISHFYRVRKKIKEAEEWILRVYDKAPDSFDIRNSYVATRLENILSDPTISFGEQISKGKREIIENIILVATKLWEDLRSTETTRNIDSIAQ